MNRGNANRLLDAFDRRYRLKKIINISRSLLITLLGVTSFLYGLRLEPGVTIFRWMTVDGTVFTTVSAAVCFAVNLWEIARNTEVTKKAVYFLRLSSAVAESVILIVVLFSQLPFFDEHLPLFDRYDSFVMHVAIPVLYVLSFIANDSPTILRPMELWHGTWFVTCYAVCILTLIASGRLPSELIPYFFLDVRNSGLGVFAAAFVFIYASAYLMAWLLSRWNRRLSWMWFRNLIPGVARPAKRRD